MSTELEEVPMRIVVALDMHRRQITYKTLDRESGEVRRGRIVPATRGAVREWLEQFAACEAEFALEETTGWRFVVEEIERAGQRAHLADPAETAGRRGRKRRAKTDNADCDLQLKLLVAGELPESWIPPAHMLELRTRVRMRKVLVDQRTAWQQRLQAQLFHQGVATGLKPRTRAGRALDVTVHQSDNKRSAGHLSHEGPELLRWALFEAAHQSARRSSPDHDYYLQVAARIDHNRACLSVARKLCRRAHYILRELGDQALAPVESEPQAEEAIQAAA
jgi:hypothetical protein